MIALSFCGFFCLGLVLILLGANQADLARDLGLDLARTGMLASAFAMGMLIGMIGAGMLYDRLPRRPLFVTSILLTAIPLFGFGPGSDFPEALFLFAVIGLGSGAYDTLFNTAIAERYGERSAKPMAVLHAGTAIGAIVGPLLVAAIATRWHWARSFHAMGAAHLALAAAALFVRLPQPTRTAGASKTDAHSIFSKAIIPFVVVAFAYLGLETSMAVFAVPYATDGLALDVIHGQTAISGMWLGLMAGRLGTLMLRGNLDGRVLIGSGILCCAAIAIGAMVGSSQIAILYFCAGFALGPVFPLVIALASQRFPHALGSVIGLAAGAGSTGCFVLPWLTGALGDSAGIEFAVGWLSVWALVIALGGAVILRGRTRAPADPIP
jgi:DHA1 family chloramphenicol resistance protein-like MFS transporter